METCFKIHEKNRHNFSVHLNEETKETSLRRRKKKNTQTFAFRIFSCHPEAEVVEQKEIAAEDEKKTKQIQQMIA